MRLCVTAATAAAFVSAIAATPSALAARERHPSYSRFTEQATLDGHTKQVCDAAFDARGRLLATCSADGTVWIWNAATGGEVRTLGGDLFVMTSRRARRDGPKEEVRSPVHFMSVAFSPDGKRLAAGSYHKKIRFWDVATGRLVHTIDDCDWHVHSLQYSRSGKYLLASERCVRVIDAARYMTLKGIYLTNPGSSFPLFPNGARYSPDERSIAACVGQVVSSSASGTVQNPTFRLQGHTDRIRSVAWSPDGRMLATGADDKTVILWDARSGRQLRAMKHHTDDVRSVDFSPLGGVIATGSNDGTACIVSVASGKILKKLDDVGDSVEVVKFTPYGRRLVTASDDGVVQIWGAR